MEGLVFASIVVVLATHVVVPWLLVVSLWRRAHPSRLAWLADALATGAYVVFVVVAGAGWDWVSYYLRLATPLAFGAGAWVSARRVWRAGLPWWRRREGVGVWARVALDALLIAFFTPVTVAALRGLAPGGLVPAELAFPLRGGVFFVGQGGASPRLNIHYEDPAQRFALDIVKLNVAGTRASGLYPSDPARYAAFGQSVHSPCEGRVLEAVDGRPDNRPPAVDVGSLAGNHVVIRCERQGVDVLLAHLMQGGVAVAAGQAVDAGQVVGRVGNSGNTSEPHLHIHAVQRGSGSVFDGEGVPLRFDGRFLVRNSLVRR